MPHVRFWQQSDLPDLTRMAAVTAWNITPPDDKPYTSPEVVGMNAYHNLMRVLGSPGGTAVVVEDQGRPVGYFLIAIQPNHKTSLPFGYAADIYLEPAYRKGGVARQMHDLAEGYLRQLGIGTLTNWTHAHNPLGQKASDRNGFRIEGMMMAKDLWAEAMAARAAVV
ncbi:MAG TPA: GNAT family N-acetyltransferase [Symbiobacteriaceae bacterium]|nr:GNAT family N-acetyltransferase [Symbiobacteriaceae bacterium]